MTKNNTLVEIFAGSAIEAEIVRSILKDSEIEVYVQDENMGTIAPWQVSAGGVGAVKLLISDLDYDKAKSIVEDYRNKTGS